MHWNQFHHKQDLRNALLTELGLSSLSSLSRTALVPPASQLVCQTWGCQSHCPRGHQAPQSRYCSSTCWVRGCWALWVSQWCHDGRVITTAASRPTPSREPSTAPTTTPALFPATSLLLAPDDAWNSALEMPMFKPWLCTSCTTSRARASASFPASWPVFWSRSTTWISWVAPKGITRSSSALLILWTRPSV